MENLQDILAWKYAPLGLRYSCGETYESLEITPDSNYPKPTLKQLKKDAVEYKEYLEANAYRVKRAKEYPPIVDQLDMIYNNGIDAWKDEIKKIKDKYPKPESVEDDMEK